MNETTDRLSALAGPSTLQSLIDTITKGVVDKFSSFLPKKNKGNMSKNAEVDSDEELANLTQRQLKLHVARAVKKAMKAQRRCSNCNRTGHNSRNCKYKKRKSKKTGKVNFATVDSDSNSSSSDNNSDSESDSGTSSEESSAESDHSINIHVSKAKKKK
ncbi:hypothetical protein C2G38_2045864 [Gigaspora rosea]|uniref:CCHC-type domain-containing protein n=1 Tax=Gigaspora rosea TaxID=44941 RepID=A0A397UBD6_9GLOM|nr:hypothetical protein C2G38_2045864 [Gigaspora rosea]